jgi:hypothetical protein
MIVTDYILNVPEAESIELMDEALQTQIRDLGAEWPSFPALGTKAVGGRKLVHVRMKAQLSKADLDNLFLFYLLDWQVIGIRSAYRILPVTIGTDEDGKDIVEMRYLTTWWEGKAAILPFMNDIIDSVDAEGNATMRPPTLADTLYLPVYAGTDPVELGPE